MLVARRPSDVLTIFGPLRPTDSIPNRFGFPGDSENLELFCDVPPNSTNYINGNFNFL